MSPEESGPPGLSRFRKLLPYLETNLDDPVFGSPCVAFMLECLSRIERRLPAFGRGYWMRLGEQTLVRANALNGKRQRIRCWQAVQLAELLGLAVEVNALRALLFVLPAASNEDLLDTLDVFVGFVIRADLPYYDIEPILRRHFGAWLPTAIPSRFQQSALFPIGATQQFSDTSRDSIFVRCGCEALEAGRSGGLPGPPLRACWATRSRSNEDVVAALFALQPTRIGVLKNSPAASAVKLYKVRCPYDAFHILMRDRRRTAPVFLQMVP
jgi:hypothetical protein